MKPSPAELLPVFHVREAVASLEQAIAGMKKRHQRGQVKPLSSIHARLTRIEAALSESTSATPYTKLLSKTLKEPAAVAGKSE